MEDTFPIAINEDYPIPTKDIVCGDEIRWTEAVFGGHLPQSRFMGHVVREGKVVKDSYGATGQHTFTIQTQDGKKLLRKGRTLYRYSVARKPWKDEDMRYLAAHEKHVRGAKAKKQAAEHKEWRRSIGERF